MGELDFARTLMPPDEWLDDWSWSWDLRTIGQFDSLESNHDIQENLELAGLLSKESEGKAYTMTDTEYSQFWIYFREENDANRWLLKLVEYIGWLKGNSRPNTLARRYKKICQG